MKRAKIVLTAVAVFAVVGGALAFKAQRIPNPSLFSFDGKNCRAAATTSLTTLGIGQTITTTLYDTFAHDGACPLKTWTVTQ